MNDDRSFDQLAQSLDGVQAPAPDLQGVQRRARRLKTRRTLTTGLLSLLILAAIAVPLAALLPLSRDEQPASHLPEVDAPALESDQFVYRKTASSSSFPIECGAKNGRPVVVLVEALVETQSAPGGLRKTQVLEGLISPKRACGKKQTGPSPSYDVETLPDTLSELPVDPAALEHTLRQGIRRGDPSRSMPEPPFTNDETKLMWNRIDDWMTSTTLSPQLEAAIMRVARDLPGGEVREGQLDPLGRPARTISYSAGGPRTTYYVDPATWLLLARTETQAGDGAEISSYLVLAMHIVDDEDQVPPPNLIPAPVTPPGEPLAQSPPSSPEPDRSAKEEAGIYAAVILEGNEHFMPGYISDAYECDDTSRTAHCAPIPGDVQQALLAELGAGFSFVAVDNQLQGSIIEGEGGTLHTLGTIEGEVPRVTVRGSYQCGSLCGGNARYVVTLRDGDWSVTGHVGGVMIS